MELRDKVKQYRDKGLSALDTYRAIKNEGIDIPWLEIKAIYLSLGK